MSCGHVTCGHVTCECGHVTSVWSVVLRRDEASVSAQPLLRRDAGGAGEGRREAAGQRRSRRHRRSSGRARAGGAEERSSRQRAPRGQRSPAAGSPVLPDAASRELRQRAEHVPSLQLRQSHDQQVRSVISPPRC